MAVLNQFWVSDTIAATQILSVGVNANGAHPVRLLVPSAWTPAVITLQESQDGGQNYYEVYDNNGNNVVLQALATRMMVIPASLLPGSGFLRIRSGTAGVPVNQTSAVTLWWLLKLYGSGT